MKNITVPETDTNGIFGRGEVLTEGVMLRP